VIAMADGAPFWDGLTKHCGGPRDTAIYISNYQDRANGVAPFAFETELTIESRGTKRSCDEILDIDGAPFGEASLPGCCDGDDALQASAKCEQGLKAAPLQLGQASGPGGTRSNESPSESYLTKAGGAGGAAGVAITANAEIVSEYTQPSAHTNAHLHTQAQIDEGPADVPTKKAKKDPNAPKRSPTAWMLFRTATTPSVKEENPGEWCTWHFGVPV
jgi:hypothetical protein